MNKETLRKEYIARINKALDYIQNNIHEPLNLEKIAKAAHFSPFHFHRIFKAFLGETLNSFIKRIRVEKAAMALSNNAGYSMTELAFICGFSSSQTFARAFKDHYGVSPTDYKNSKICNTNSNNGNDLKFEVGYDSSEGRPRIIFKSLTNKSMNVEVKDVPEMHVAYIRHIGPYKGDSKLFGMLFGKLAKWAGTKNLFGPDTKFMAVYHDDPSITDESKLRLDVCMTVPEDTQVEGEIGKQTFPGGKVAVAHFELKDPKEYEAAWTSVYKEWLPESGYQPDNRPPYELYLNNPKEHPEGIHIVDICIPVKPM